MKERRKAIRFDSVTSVHVASAPSSKEMTAEEFVELVGNAETLDMSTSGCRLMVAKNLPKGSEFTFDLKFDDHIVSVRGKVVRIKRRKKGWEVGVQFCDMEPFTQHSIQLYLEESGAEELDKPE